jgi:hypothetical protein
LGLPRFFGGSGLTPTLSAIFSITFFGRPRFFGGSGLASTLSVVFSITFLGRPRFFFGGSSRTNGSEIKCFCGSYYSTTLVC